MLLVALVTIAAVVNVLGVEDAAGSGPGGGARGLFDNLMAAAVPVDDLGAHLGEMGTGTGVSEQR